jgi:hypothetical protein
MQRIILSLLAISLWLPASGFAEKPGKVGESRQTVKKAVVIWRQPYDIRTRNLFYGSGGRTGQPRGPFRFIEEDPGGSNPKFVVEDARGVRWKVKLGSEAKPETAATRLLWAVGYFADETYYLPRLRVAGLSKLSRGQKYVSTDGTVQEARFERSLKKVDDWSWFENPFVGTKEFNGLRVMMTLINNWDLKQSNNAIYELRGRELRYLVSDLGGTFGKTGGDWTRSKGNLENYLESEFVDEITPTTVDLVLHSRPPLLYAVAVPYYVKRTRMEKIAEDIPRAHARWIGQWLAQLSHQQIRDAFRGAGYAPREAQAYAIKVRERINHLNEL